MKKGTPRILPKDEGGSPGHAEKEFSLPPLKKCLEGIRFVAKDRHHFKGGGNKIRRETFASLFAFLCHLKVDQGKIFESQIQQELSEKQPTCPPLESTPAFEAIIGDLALFNCLMAMLSSKHLEESKPTSISAHNSTSGSKSNSSLQSSKVLSLGGSKPGASHSDGSNRKRSLSISSEHSNETNSHKIQKIHQSPHFPEKIRSESHVVSDDGLCARSSFDFHVPVYAAVVIYVTWRHVDHWPAPLMRAFAEDSFGPRLWVDNEQCEMFIQNLKVSLAENATTDKKMLTKARTFVVRYGGSTAQNHAARTTLANPKRKIMRMTSEENKQNTQKLVNSAKEDSKEDSQMKDDSSSSDSDSGEEYVVEETSFCGTSKASMKRKSSSEDDVADSVKSMGDDSVVDTSKHSGKKAKMDNIPSTITTNKTTRPMSLVQDILDIKPVRPRYFGVNLDLAYSFISETLKERLQHKTKQNSRLISALADFTSVPKVRSLSAQHLERWLQSPALSGLARSLFASIVGAMRNQDPPLKEDIAAIDSILSMKLKANQFSAHVENVTMIAKKIPTCSIARHIFLHLLRDELMNLDTSAKPSNASKLALASDSLQMITAVHAVLPAEVSADGLAGAMLTLLLTPAPKNVPSKAKSPSNKALDSRSHMYMVRLLLRTVVGALGVGFDGSMFVASLLRPQKGVRLPSLCREYDDVARLAFESITLMAPLPPNSGNYRQKGRKVGTASGVGETDGPRDNLELESLDEETAASLSATLMSTRKAVLQWCVRFYVKPFLPKIQEEEESRKKSQATAQNRKSNKGGNRTKKDEAQSNTTELGAGPPDFRSILDGRMEDGTMESDPQSSHLLSTIKCLLFLHKSSSPQLLKFLSPESTKEENQIKYFTSFDQAYQIEMCSYYGTDVDDAIMWIILKSASLKGEGVPAAVALSLTEELFLKCKNGARSHLRVTDSEIVWKLYSLTEYSHSACHAGTSSEDHKPKDDKSNSDTKCNGHSNEVISESEKSKGEEKQETCKAVDIPILAYPGQWWRTTALVLVMCGSSPPDTGASMWNENPTVQSIMKMMVTGRYRFPTVDCDDMERELMRKGESDAREQESKVAAQLFLPKSETKAATVKVDENPSPTFTGSRVSARQREKQAKLTARKREKDHAAAMAAARKEKKLIKEAQKTIMLLDPRSAARKPPKEAVNLILAINNLFDLSANFLRCTDPDFLVKTMKCSSRESIERAYHWLIPVISSHPDVIDRLPPGASCFLLLRAYGTDGDNESEQLLELSAPLLRHASLCLMGDFGEADSIRAAELLLGDITDRSADRRRCARRVLQEATRGSSNSGLCCNPPLHHNCGWLFCILSVKHTSAVLPTVINCVARALAFERGGVLRAYILGFHQQTKFARERGITVSVDFVFTLCDLLSARPQVCAAGMDRFHDFRDLALTEVHREFESQFNRNVQEENMEAKTKARLVRLMLWNDSPERKEAQVLLPLSLLRAAVVLVSNWQEDECFETKESDLKPSYNAVRDLTRYLIMPPDGDFEKGTSYGASGAVFENTERRALSVEEWTMLAKSRCSFIARHAALSAPAVFLPRLLLCCGLPRSSFTTMLDRLGKLGDSSSDASRTFKDLLIPSATSEWGVGHIGNRRAVARKLLGRVSAYFRHLKQNSTVSEIQTLEHAVSSSFVGWLSEECEDARSRGFGSSEKSKRKQKKAAHGGKQSKGVARNFASGTEVDSFLQDLDISCDILSSAVAKQNSSVHVDLIASEEPNMASLLDGITTKEVVASCCAPGGNVCALDERFQVFLSTRQNASEKVVDGVSQFHLRAHEFAKIMLDSIHLQTTVSTSFSRVLMKWVPLLTQPSFDETLWKMLFRSGNVIVEGRNWGNEVLNQVTSRCAESWSEAHIRSCQTWILSWGGKLDFSEEMSVHRAVRFLVVSSRQFSAHVAGCNGIPGAPFVCLESENNVSSAVRLALRCGACDEAKTDFGFQDITTSEPLVNLTGRNSLPEFVTLVLLIGKSGKAKCRLVVRLLLAALAKEVDQRAAARSIVLRLYCYYPSYVNLGDRETRKTLVEAATLLSTSWVRWRCEFDDQLLEMIGNLSKNPHQKLRQSIAEFAKHHPLLLARHFPLMARILEEDGYPPGHDSDQSQGRPKRIRFNAKRAVTVNTDDGLVKLKTRIWGDSITEAVWVAILDIVESIPTEVVYEKVCVNMGLLEVMAVYLKMFAVRTEIQCTGNTSKMRSKVGSMLSSFRKGNQESCSSWLQQQLPGAEGFGTIKEVILRCHVDVFEKEQKETG